jgi:glycosyltransferase involved in cell wall biosynthesis
MDTSPKILLLCSMSQSTANGITIANLFKGWPVDRIALAEFNEGPEQVCVPGIQNYYFLGNKEMRYIAPFHLLRKFGASRVLRTDFVGQRAEGVGQGAESQVQRATSNAGKHKAYGWKDLILKVQRWYLQKTGLMLVSRKFRISPEFEQWVRDFDPHLAYCVTSDLCKLEFFSEVLQHFGIKGCIHVFDDFLASKHGHTLFPRYWKNRLDRTFRRACQQSTLHLAIGDKMADEYTERYGHTFYGFHNPIDPSIWLAERGQIDDGESRRRSAGDGEAMADSGSEQSSVIANSEELMANGEEIIAKDNDSPSAISHPPSNDLVVPPSAIRHPPSNPPTTENKPTETPYPISYIPSSESVFRFLYAGKINKDTVGPIKRFMEAVERLNKAGHRISFKIHSPYPFDEIKLILGEGAEKVYGGKLPYAELPAAYRAADGLLLPLDFTEATIRYIRLSMLTKVSEYMISGTAIFCFAPKEVAATEYLIEHDAGVHCGDPEQVEQAILDFIRDGESRCRVAANAVERARQHHLMGQVNERFRGLLTSAA